MSKQATETSRGGKREGAGRKPDGDEARTVTVQVRVTYQEAERFRELGGADWLRRQLVPPTAE